MKVNSNDTNLASQFISNSSEVKINKPLNGKGQLNSEMQRLAKDTYHKEQPKEPDSTYNKPMSIKTNHVLTSRAAEEKALTNIWHATVNLYMPGGEVSKSVEKMFNQYNSIMADIIAEEPSLASTNWGISVNKSGELEVTGTLSDTDKMLISDKLNSNDDLVNAAKQFRTNFLEYVNLGVKGWSNYKVNEDNFSQIFDLKEIIESSMAKESFKKAWNKDFSWLELNDNISSQLRRNAEKE